MRILVAVALASLAAAGCYRHHLRGEDADAGSTRCGSTHCARVDPSRRRVSIDTAGLVGNVEGDVSGLRGAPAVDGVAFELDPCAPRDILPCPVTITVAGIGADVADPAVLGGAVEATLRDRAIVVRGDPCPGCSDGHEAGLLLFAAVAGELSPGFDLALGDVTVGDAGVVCESRGRGGESTARHRIAYATTFSSARIVLDEGEELPLPTSDLHVRLLGSSYECVTADLPPPRPLEAAEWVIWNVAGL
jgi:hypothetical protein